MSPQCDFDCCGCNYLPTCDKPAAVEEREQDAAPVTDPHICPACTCHPETARRIGELEQDMSRVKELLFGLAAFFERAGGGE